MTKEKDNELIVHQNTLSTSPTLPDQTSKRIEVKFAQQADRILATAEIGIVGMNGMSKVDTHAQWKLATTATAVDLLAKGAAATRDISPVERATQQALFEDYARRMAQLAELTNIHIVRKVDHAIEELNKRTMADVFEDLDAKLTDAFSTHLGHHARISYLGGPSMPLGKRQIQGE